jgi:hypothetical protein
VQCVDERREQRDLVLDAREILVPPAGLDKPLTQRRNEEPDRGQGRAQVVRQLCQHLLQTRLPILGLPQEGVLRHRRERIQHEQRGTGVLASHGSNR